MDLGTFADEVLDAVAGICGDQVVESHAQVGSVPGGGSRASHECVEHRRVVRAPPIFSPAGNLCSYSSDLDRHLARDRASGAKLGQFRFDFGQLGATMANDASPFVQFRARLADSGSMSADGQPQLVRCGPISANFGQIWTNLAKLWFDFGHFRATSANPGWSFANFERFLTMPICRPKKPMS